MLSFCLGVQFDDNRTTQLSGNVFLHKEFDLLIAYLPKGLPVPLISPSKVLEWNKHDNNEIGAIL